jgi:MFS transporter, DHA2 family, multidrug resistance protein
MTAPAAHQDRIPLRRVIAFAAMCFGMFMAFLDIQIVSSSLSNIQAGLAASGDEIPWVQTAYLIAEVVAIPLSGFLSRALGTRTLFAVSAAGFTFASFMCGFASTIDDMILWRAVQGFIGGGMIPTVFAAAFTIFPPSRHAMVTPLIGLIATLAPTLGPTVGGYITDALSWHWLFFINVVPGVAVTAAALALIDFDEPEHGLLSHFDWWGLIAMAGFLGALQYVLEEGPRHDWLQDDAIFYAAIVSAVSAAAFFWRALTARVPIVDLRAYANRNFAVGSVFSFVLGIGQYGLNYLYPLYLAEVRGYSPLMIGETMFVSGIAMAAAAPVAGQLMDRIDPRYMLMAGFLIFAIGTSEMFYVTRDWDFWELLWPQIFRGVGLILALVPITKTSLDMLPPERLKNASGLFNLSRNLGGAIGLAVLNTALNHRMDLHLARLHDAVNWSRSAATDMLANLTARFHDFGSDAPLMAIKEMSLMARREATVMSFADVFLMMTVLFATLAALGVVMKRPVAGAAAGVPGH